MSFASIKKNFQSGLSASASEQVFDVESTKERLDAEIDSLQGDLDQQAFSIIFVAFPSEASLLDDMYKTNPSFQRSEEEVRGVANKLNKEPKEIPSNELVDAMISALRAHLIKLSRMCNTLTLWLKLQAPQVSADQESVYTAIQSGMMEALGGAEEMAMGVLDQFAAYHLQRAGLAKKVIKHPECGDYRTGLISYDCNIYLKFSLIPSDLRTLYLSLYDDLSKNFAAVSGQIKDDAYKHTMY